MGKVLPIISMLCTAAITCTGVACLHTPLKVKAADTADIDMSSRVGYPFFTDKDDSFTQSVNGLWSVYGDSQDSSVDPQFGNEPAYYEWMAEKIMWCSDDDYKQGLKDRIREFPMGADGYVWSWGNNPEWPTGGLHFDNNVKYISAVSRVLSWENSTEFLDETDDNTSGDGDVSNGMTVRQKVESAMNYCLTTLHGNDGLMIEDNGKNTGLADGDPSNYWDNLPFGYKDGYNNIYFYNALLSMANIENMESDPSAANNYRTLAGKVYDTYNGTFWDSDKGRYIGCVDVNGAKHDYGFTFLNTEALTYGLGDAAKAASIYDWLDGKRTISTDTSTGTGIYTFKFAPRSNTLSMGSSKPYWWYSVGNQITVDNTAQFGQHMENGGAILYTEFYDLMGRFKYLGADNAKARFDAVSAEYQKDKIERNPKNNVGVTWKLGTIGSFPESGLVPTAFLYGFLGIQTDANGLTIAPNLSSDMKYAGVKDLDYAGNKYEIAVSKSKITMQSASGGKVVLNLANLYPNATYTVKTTDESGNNQVSLQTISTDANGKVSTSVDLTGARLATLLYQGNIESSSSETPASSSSSSQPVSSVPSSSSAPVSSASQPASSAPASSTSQPVSSAPATSSSTSAGVSSAAAASDNSESSEAETTMTGTGTTGTGTTGTDTTGAAAVSENGSSTAKDVPYTGDGSVLPIAILAAACAGAFITVKVTRRK